MIIPLRGIVSDQLAERYVEPACRLYISVKFSGGGGTVKIVIFVNKGHNSSLKFGQHSCKK